MKKILAGLAVLLASQSIALSLHAQDVQNPATIVLSDGQRLAGDLLDLNRDGFWMNIKGTDRSFPESQVVAIEFVAGPVLAKTQAKIKMGQPFIMLRNGQMVDGRLNDIGGTSPLKIIVNTIEGLHEFMSNDIAQIYVNPGVRSAPIRTP